MYCVVTERDLAPSHHLLEHAPPEAHWCVAVTLGSRAQPPGSGHEWERRELRRHLGRERHTQTLPLSSRGRPCASALPTSPPSLLTAPFAKEVEQDSRWGGGAATCHSGPQITDNKCPGISFWSWPLSCASVGLSRTIRPVGGEMRRVRVGGKHPRWLSSSSLNYYILLSFYIINHTTSSSRKFF